VRGEVESAAERKGEAEESGGEGEEREERAVD
jgi:hypothetical protein